MTKRKYFDTVNEAKRFFYAMNKKYGRSLQGIACGYDIKTKKHVVEWVWTSRA